MAMAARAEIEALLRARKLDTTLTSTHPFETSGAAAGDPADQQYVVATGIAALDARLGGGFARGQLSEVVGPRSSGRTAVVLSALAGAALRGELVAFIDTFDTLDPPSARACGVDLTRLLWVRGRSVDRDRPRSEVRSPKSEVRPSTIASTRSGRGELVEPRSPTSVRSPRLTSDIGHRTSDDVCAQSIDRALKACNLILQAGGFDLVVLDLADAPPLAIRRLPFTTWFRLQRPIEGSSTACVILASEPVARSAGGVTVALQRVSHAPPATRSWGSLFTGFEVEARLGRARGVAEACTFECRAKP